jgi:hypothetical protein
MSQENVELLYRGFDAWNRRDLDMALAGSHAEVEITPVRGPAATARPSPGRLGWGRHGSSSTIRRPSGWAEGPRFRSTGR